MAKIHRGKNHLKQQRNRLLSPGMRLAELFNNVVPLTLIGISAAALLYLLFNPDIPLQLKYQTPVVWEQWRKVVMEYHPYPGFFVRYCSWLFFAEFADVIVMCLLFPLRFILGIVMMLLHNVMPSVVRISVYALPVMIILWQLYFPLTLGRGRSSQAAKILEGGMHGEEMALQLLEDLGDECHVFTNLVIPREEYDDFGRQKTSETDLITVTPSGVTVIEVKYYRGSVHGDASDQQLIHRKYHRDGSYQDEPFYNPIRQVSTHVQSLKAYLLANGINVNPYKCVLFNHEAFELDITDRGQTATRYCPVFLLGDQEELYDYVDADRVRLRPDQIDRIVAALDALR